jgi:hypothetical protein
LRQPSLLLLLGWPQVLLVTIYSKPLIHTARGTRNGRDALTKGPTTPCLSARFSSLACAHARLTSMTSRTSRYSCSSAAMGQKLPSMREVIEAHGQVYEWLYIKEGMNAVSPLNPQPGERSIVRCVEGQMSASCPPLHQSSLLASARHLLF